jgi:hypothetical protein
MIPRVSQPFVPKAAIRQACRARSTLRAPKARADVEPQETLRADVAVKLGVAASTDRLDLTDCDLERLPYEVRDRHPHAP